MTPIQIIKRYDGKRQPRTPSDRAMGYTVYLFPDSYAGSEAYHKLLLHPDCHRRFDMILFGNKLTLARR